MNLKTRPLRMSSTGSGNSGAVESGAHRLQADKVRALVIDDSDTARASAAALLRLAGCEVHELPSAIGASRLAMRERIDVAVVDISMPGLSGDKLIQLFRNNLRLQDLVIVVVSGRSTEELASISSSGLANGVLPKSCIRDELLPLLRRLLPGRLAPSHVSALSRGA